MDSFTYSALPCEILFEIFSYLNGKNVLKCRRVCNHWKDVVDDFCTERKCKEYCENEHRHIDAAFIKSKLNWLQLYKSLSLWSKVYKAAVSFEEFPRNVQSFQLVKDGVIAICENHTDPLSMFSDRIVYYNIETMEVIDTMTFDFFFSAHKENENLICVVTRSGKLCLYPKETREKFFGRKLTKYGQNTEFGHYSLFNTEVYYQANNAQLRKAKLKRKKDGRLVIRDYEILDHALLDRVLSFSYINNDNLYVLADELIKVNIYRYANHNLSLVSGIDRWCSDKEGELSEFGFDWTTPEIIEWLFSLYQPSETNITTLRPLCVSIFGTTVIIATAPCILNIFINPYSADGKLMLFKVKPTYQIDLNEVIKESPGDSKRKIKCIDVVEIENGHLLVVLIQLRLFIIKLDHNDDRRQISNRSLTIRNKRRKLSYVIPSKIKYYCRRLV